MILRAFRTRYILALAAWVTGTASAVVSLNDAYRSAVEKTEPVAIQRSMALQADERVDQILGKVFPQLNLLASYTYQDPVNNGGATSAFTRSDQYSVRLNFVQPLFHGFGEWAEWRSRKALRAAAEAREENTRLTLYGTVADAYFAVLAEETDCKNIQSLLELMEKLVGELKQRVSIGRSRLGDRLAAEADAAAMRAQLLAQQNILAAARERLQAVTGLGAEAELADDVSAPPEPPPLAALLSALAERPDFRAAQKDAESAAESVAVARAAHYPSLDAVGNYYLTRTGVLSGSHWDAGLQFTLPLFQGGVITASVREGVQRQKAAELTLALLKRQAEQDLRTAHANSSMSVLQERELSIAMKLAEQNYEQQRRDYRNGLVNNLDVLTALEKLAERRRGHDRLLFDAQARRVRLDVLTGKMPSG